MFARERARGGITVVTPEIPGLAEFDISPRLTDGIERAALWLARDSGLSPDGRIGVAGVSFSGGLAVVAAGRDSLRDRVSYVFSLGGHHDLPRVLQYLCTGAAPEPARPAAVGAGDGVRAASVTAADRRPHDYGLAVLLLMVADRVVPASQADELRALVRRFLWASYVDRYDRPRAAAEFTAIRAAARAAPEPAATLLTYMSDRDVERLGARLLPFAQAAADHPALSPSRAPMPIAPVFLLHGRSDTVIPAVESEYLAADLRGHVPVRLLVSGLLSHAAADQPMRAADVLELVAFWGELLASAAGNGAAPGATPLDDVVATSRKLDTRLRELARVLAR
jgi:dienelactone hydrolase